MPSEDDALSPLSVVVTTYGRECSVEPVLRAVLADPAATEVVVVCDASPDATPQLLRRMSAAEPRLRPLLLEQNVGQPRARWRGVQAASHERVLSLDDDVLVAPGCITGHARGAAAGGVLVGYMPTPRLPAWQSPSTYQYAENYETRCREWEAGAEVLQGMWAGNFSFDRSDFLRATDGFDFNVEYHEDRDLGLRLAALGLTGRFDRDLASTHQFVRSFAASLRDSYRAGIGATKVGATHGDDHGPASMQQRRAGASLPRRVLLRLAEFPRLAQPSLAVLTSMVALARRTHSTELALRASRWAWELCYIRGMSGMPPP